MNAALDRGALEPWLAERVDRFFGPPFVDRFSGDQSNPTLLLSSLTSAAMGSNEQHHKAVASLKRRGGDHRRHREPGERIHLYLSTTLTELSSAQVRVTGSLSADAKLERAVF
jgi:hypothetical protein